jgi:hypothetical protein
VEPTLAVTATSLNVSLFSVGGGNVRIKVDEISHAMDMVGVLLRTACILPTYIPCMVGPVVRPTQLISNRPNYVVITIKAIICFLQAHFDNDLLTVPPLSSKS